MLCSLNVGLDFACMCVFLYRYLAFLYELWKKWESNGISSGWSLLASVVEQVLEKSGVNDVILNDRILHSFRWKIYFRQTKQLLEK